MKPLTLAIAVAMAAGPALAQVGGAPAVPAPVAAPAAPVVLAPERDAAGIYQVYRATDSAMTCEQLFSELNSLNAQIKTAAAAPVQQAAAPASGASAASAAAGLLGAARGLGGLGGLGNMGALMRGNPLVGAQVLAGAVQQGRAAAAAAQPAAAPPAAAAPAAAGPPSDQQQRLSRVSSLVTQKAC